jgi:hypothetical protein
MKNSSRFTRIIMLLCGFAAVLFLLSFSCKKDNDDDNNNNTTGYACWGENWLIGTWEGTTPSSVQPFGGTKLRIVFEKAELKMDDNVAGNPRKLWAYDGTLTWDAGGAGEWSMKFEHKNWPQPDINVIIYECLTNASINQAISNISIRIADTIQLNPWHSIDLDWGPFIVNSSSAISSIEFYGDVEIDKDGEYYRADYPPGESPIVLTKK